MSNKVAYLTGFTGFIGGELARYLYHNENFSSVYLLIRPQTNQTIQNRFQKVVQKWKIIHKIDYDESFFKLEEGFLDQFNSFSLPSDVTHIFHASASTHFGENLKIARRLNVFATQNLLIKARQCSNFERFIHYSTAFASGDLKGAVLESDQPGSFQNNYERTKFESEQSVRYSGLPYTILRPSIVVGDSKTGFTQHFRVFYSLLRAWLHGNVPRAPLHGKKCVDMVPVDFVCVSSLIAALSTKGEGRTIHICAGEKKLVDPLSVFQYAVDVFEMPKPKISPFWILKVLNYGWAQPFLSRPIREYLATLKGHIPYLQPRYRFFDTSTLEKLNHESKVECPSLDQYGDTMFRFCKETKWGKNLRGIDNV